ncbi:MAG: hypothetical protein Q7S09_00515 [bacterium]|nr:hypothetical protein [bacterium]
MEPITHLKIFLANLSLAAVLFSGQAAFSSVKSAARHVIAKDVEITNVRALPSQTVLPPRIVLTNRPPETQAGTPTATKTLIDGAGEKFIAGNKNPFQKPFSATASASSPKPSSKPLPSPNPIPTPKPLPKATTVSTTSPAPQSTPQPMPTLPPPTASPDFSVSTLLIGNNPSYIKTGAIIHFSVFVRDADERTIKNKTLTFLVNGKALTASTDESGNAFLEIQAPDILGDFKVVLQLGSKTALFTVNVIDSKPILSLSSFAFDIEGYSVRLRNAAGEAVPNWQVTAYKRDGSVLGIKFTSELGAVQFDLPPREESGHIYACAEVKDVAGRECTEW